MIFSQKFKFFVKNGNFVEKAKSWSKIQIFLINQNFGQTSKCWSKIEMLVKIEILVENVNIYIS